MKKRIGLSIAALSCLIGGFAIANEEKLPSIVTEETKMEESFRLGKDAIAKIRNDYAQGRFDGFLKESHISFSQIQESGTLSDFAQMREEAQLNPKWVDAVKLLQKEKNEELLQAVKGQDSLFAEKVKSAATLNETQEEAFEKLSAFHHMVPGSGKNSDENALILLDLEYEYKAIHLGVPGEDLAKAQELREQYHALKMEHMDKMLLASQSFSDESLKEAVVAMSKNLDDHLARNWDRMDLLMLAKGRVKPVDSTQTSVVSILKDSQQKLSDLAKNF